MKKPYNVDRSISGIYTSQLATEDVKAAPMLRGRARGGPRDKIILEATSSWNGIVSHYREARKTSMWVPYPGHYRWNGETWVWRKDPDGDQKYRETEESS